MNMDSVRKMNDLCDKLPDLIQLGHAMVTFDSGQKVILTYADHLQEYMAQLHSKTGELFLEITSEGKTPQQFQDFCKSICKETA